MLEEERYEREQDESHWNCPFFRHCWNEDLRLPTRRDCPECNNQYRGYWQSQTNRRSIHERLGQPIEDWRINKCRIHYHCDAYDEEIEEVQHVWQENQWCPGGLSRSQKRRVQHLRETEIKIEKTKKAKKSQVWKAKQTADSGKSAHIGMQCILPAEFRASKNQEVYSDFDESEYEEIAAYLALTSQAVFDKPIRYRHLKALYIKGLVNGKPMKKMLVDGGAAVNLMPYSTFRKLGKTPKDLIKTDMQLRDFGGNVSDTRGAISVELTIGSKTLITTFFIIDGKGFYSLLLGRD